uniref:Kinetochore protein Spc24 n=1 Tax=Taeniopygia guttata TaxID=59729 RepID=A0A674GHW2_TAEGU
MGTGKRERDRGLEGTGTGNRRSGELEGPGGSGGVTEGTGGSRGVWRGHGGHTEVTAGARPGHSGRTGGAGDPPTPPHGVMGTPPSPPNPSQGKAPPRTLPGARIAPPSTGAAPARARVPPARIAVTLRAPHRAGCPPGAPRARGPPRPPPPPPPPSPEGLRAGGGTKAEGPRGGRDADGVTHRAGETIAERGGGERTEPMRDGAGPRMRRAAPPGSNGARDGESGKMEAAPFPPVEAVEELSQELLRELSSGCTEELLQRGLHRRLRLQRRLREAQTRARGLAQGLAEAEARLLARLAAAQADVRRLRGRGQELDTELERARGALSAARDRSRYPWGDLGGFWGEFGVFGGDLGFLGGIWGFWGDLGFFGRRVCLDPPLPTALRRALEELRERHQEEEEEEEDEQSLPPDVYVAQLYYEISRIDWDCSAEPGRIRGVHYGPDIAVPLDLDAAQHSGTFVSDYLWGLVPTEWRPRRPPVLPTEPLAP